MITLKLNKFKSELLWAATRQGSFQRSNIYKDKNVNDSDKLEFRIFVKGFLYKNVFAKYFNSKITEKQLLKIIAGLQSATKLKHKNILLGGNLRFGNAQKFVNLYVKNMWIAGWIKTPPHFPIDRIIQNKFQKIVPWTDMNKVQYLSIISEAKNHMIKDGYKDLATWERNKYFETYIEQ